MAISGQTILDGLDAGKDEALIDTAAAMTERSRGSAWILAQLRQAILEGRYAPGSKLPAERRFASAFGASRATIRTALSHLETERLVTRRLGAGTFVSVRPRDGREEIAELTSPLELIEVRVGLEPNMVRLAVLNASNRDIERLSGAIERMEACSGDGESFTLWDKEFHQLIAEATRNPLMVWIYREINDVRTHRQWSAMKNKVLTPRRIAEYNEQHLALFEAIRSRDIEAAVAVVTHHLHYARRQLMGAGAADTEEAQIPARL
ncbi:MAG: FadR family transcriptional regulator [Gammaproteobacteria bacterium]|nr:FadR family transcriptional regulator [Gammaproteobacteria bacterium]